MDELYEAKVNAAQQLHEKARYMRGRFLNSVAVIERNIAVILTEYFCTTDEDKREIFFTKVAEKLSLQKKKEILTDIVKADHPKYWEENKEFLNNLNQIQEFRNKLAHSVLDVSDEALSRPLDEGIGFVQWKKGAPITQSEFQEFEVKANMLSSKLSDIKRLLPYKEKPIV
jgi:ribosomal protein L31